MSNRIIPGADLTQYQRWEPATLVASQDARLRPFSSIVRPATLAESAPPVVTPPPPDPEAEARAAAAAAQAEIHRQAYQDGYQEGLRAGREAAEHEARAIAATLDALRETVQTLEAELAEQVLSFALTVSRHMIRDQLLQAPALIEYAVREAVSTAVCLGTQPRLFLHPDDVQQVSPLLNAELTQVGWVIMSDAALTPGGCRIETQSGQLDGTLETRWQRVLASLGKVDSAGDIPPPDTTPVS